MKLLYNRTHVLKANLCSIPLVAGLSAIGFMVALQASSAEARWPDAPAARMVDNIEAMFIESTLNGRHAWLVVPEKGDNGEAIDYFTGKHQSIRVERDVDGRLIQAFSSLDGREHAADSRGFAFTDTPSQGGIPSVTFGFDALHLSATQPGCSVTVTVNRGARGGEKGLLVADRPRTTGCRSGHISSLLGATLNLDDGTFLAVVDCMVVRLRSDTLDPIGATPLVTSIDADKVRSIIASAPKPIADAVDYFHQSLDMKPDAGTACRD